MNRMKKYLCLCLAAVLLALAACGGNGSSQAGKDSGKAADISGTVLLDNEDVKVTVEKMDFYVDEEQKMLRMNIENKRDQTVWVNVQWAAVNGFMDPNPTCITFVGEEVSMGGAMEVPAGSDGDSYGYGLMFSMRELEMAGVMELGDIELRLSSGEDDFGEDHLGEPVTVHVADVEQTVNEEGTVLLDNEYVKLVAQGQVTDDYFGPELVIYACNKSEESFYLNMDNVAVNGMESFAYYGAELVPGKRAVDRCAFDGFTEDTETKIQELSCTFSAYGTENGEALFVSDEITVTLN